MNIAKLAQSAARAIIEAAVMSMAAATGLFAAVLVNPLLPL